MPNMYTCDACRFIFPAENLPERCPDCGKESITKKAKKDGQERKLVLPAVRPATTAEIAEHEKALIEIAAEDAFADRIQEPRNYDMSMGEHNLALMLLFAFNNCPAHYLRSRLDTIVDESREDVATTDSALRLYTDAKKLFTSEIGKERRQFDACGTLPHGPALDVLYAFRQKEFVALIGSKPNLGDVRRVDIKEIAEKPSAGFLRFLADWYNSLENEPDE